MIYPTKQTVNFAIKENKKRNYKVIVPVTVIASLAFLIFVKFGIVDLLAVKTILDYSAQGQQQQYDTLVAFNKDYAKVQLEYNSFNLRKGSDGKVINITPVKSLEMLEKEILATAHVENLSINADTITVKFGGVSLDRISSIYNTIKQNEMVESVQVYTAGSQSDNSAKSIVTMTIILKGASQNTNAKGGGSK